MAGIVHEVENRDLLAQVRQQAAAAAQELAEAAHLHRGQIVVVGCSTSEVVGKKVGSWSTPEAAQAIFRGLQSVFAPRGVYLAAQCCEHLNRSIVIEEECRAKYNLAEVNAVPQPKAGGSFATNAYKAFNEPVLVETVPGNAGIDIGGTLIGMHLKAVAVPVRLSIKKIGEANIICARTRPRLIGGQRAIYKEM